MKQESKRQFHIAGIPFSVLEILLMLGLTLMAVLIRYIFRNVVTDDYKIFFEPWVATLREAGGGIRGLSAEFEYVDYTTPYLTILSFISICPFLNTLLLMKIVSIFFDFVAAFAVFAIVYEVTGRRTLYGIFGYGALLLAPTVIANSAMWAQCDIIFTSFVLWSVYFILKSRPAAAMVFYGIAFAFKLQTLFLAPFYVILWMKGKVKLKHFLFLPLMYIIGMIPALLAGENFWELLGVYIFQANGQMDIYALSHKFPNIFQFFGTDTFLVEYADAAIYVTLGALMVEMYVFARKRYEMDAKLFFRMAMLCTMTLLYFLPHMHERYAILVDVFAIIIFFLEPDKLYIPVLTQIASFGGYALYLSKQQVLPITVYALLFTFLMLDHGRYCVRAVQGTQKNGSETRILSDN